MTQVPIYTIGYGNRSIDDFIALLQRYEIEFLIDVRSQPFSRHAPQFSQHSLQNYLKQSKCNIRYLFMGDLLGGRPADETCYVAGKVDYAKVTEKPFYQQGISRLHTAVQKHLHVALMCAELKPQQCHRSKLIGNSLLEQGLEVAHIDEEGLTKGQPEINRILTGNHEADQLSLFGEALVVVNKKIGSSRKKYASY